MPLGIELAAAWVRVLSCAEIAEEMARSLDFLVRADCDVSPRHHSMRAVFDSSWRLLAPTEQQVAARLAVLRGSFDRAAQAIAGATLPQLAALIDKSFIRSGIGIGARPKPHLPFYNCTNALANSVRLSWLTKAATTAGTCCRRVLINATWAC